MSAKDKRLTNEQLCEEIRRFRQQQRTLILASQSVEQQVLASYAPFVEDEQGNFFILLSGLATHSRNVQQHQHEQTMLSVLFIEDEQLARNVFARKRLNYSCQVSIIPRKHEKWQEKITLLQDKLGKTIDLLSALADFELFCLSPQKGYYVRGFGQAYELDSKQQPLLISS